MDAPSSAAPAFYDDLAATRAEAWRSLALGVADRRAPLHTLTVATVGCDGAPRARVVVLRKADGAGWRVRFHTDLRAQKALEFKAEPRVALVGYDAAAKIQVRLEGVARLHAGDDIATIGWIATQPMSRMAYSIAPAPGRPIAAGGGYDLPSEPDGDGGFANFAVVDVAVDRLEWLYLAYSGHRRASFTRGGGMTWLVP